MIHTDHGVILIMKTNLAFLFTGLLAGGPALAMDVAPAADQIA